MKAIFGVVLLASQIPAALAFEFSTHAEITQKAVQRVLALDENKELLRTLGLNLPDSPVFMTTTKYYDIGTLGPRERAGLSFETAKMFPAFRILPYTLNGWVARGAIREDDDASGTDPSPKGDDPDGDMHRVFRHFFDPYHNGAPLTVLGGDPCHDFSPVVYDPPYPCATAVDWALGTTNYQTSLVPDGNRRNHFTIAGAREAMFRALTGYDRNFTFTGSDERTRRLYWNTAFRALGDVLHLNQDMAQPQHVRNDSHAGVTPRAFTGHKSTFEQFVEANETRADALIVRGDTTDDCVPFTPQPFMLDGYPSTSAGVVRFPMYSDYWTTGGTNMGLADYTNRGFFSLGTNIGMSGNGFPKPSQDVTVYSAMRVPATNWQGDQVYKFGNQVMIKLYQGEVDDAYDSHTDTGVNLTANGAWNQFFSGFPGNPGYTLYRENYIDQARLVLPRAVGYSAGIFNHFFRGKLQVSLPAEQVYAVADYQANFGFDYFKVMVQNVTAPIAVKGPDGTITPY